MLSPPAAPSLSALRQRSGDPPGLTLSSHRLVEGRGLAQQEVRERPPSGRARQSRSRSIGQLDFLLPVPPPCSLSGSLSHPSIGPAPSLSAPPPHPSSSCPEASALLFCSSYFRSVEVASGPPPPAGGRVLLRRQRCRSGSFGDIINRSDSDSALPMSHDHSQGSSKPLPLSSRLHPLQRGGLEKCSSLGELRGSSALTVSCSTRSLCPPTGPAQVSLSTSSSSSGSGGRGIQHPSGQRPGEEEEEDGLQGEEAESGGGRKRRAFHKIFKKKQGRH